MKLRISYLILISNRSIGRTKSEEGRSVDNLLDGFRLFNCFQNVLQSTNVDLSFKNHHHHTPNLSDDSLTIDLNFLQKSLTETNRDGSGSQGSTKAAAWKTISQPEQASFSVR